MKTLDEVIRAFEICIGPYCSNAEFDVCPYLGESDMGCMKEPEKDALHYLKEYRETKIHLACLDDAEIRGDNTQVVNNPPLTWEELRTMEGKPVWIETDDNGEFWTVVDNFRTICNQECLCCSKGYMCRSTHARGDWQAYRKKRKNVQS